MDFNSDLLSVRPCCLKILLVLPLVPLPLPSRWSLNLLSMVYICLDNLASATPQLHLLPCALLHHIHSFSFRIIPSLFVSLDFANAVLYLEKSFPIDHTTWIQILNSNIQMSRPLQSLSGLLSLLLPPPPEKTTIIPFIISTFHCFPFPS